MKKILLIALIGGILVSCSNKKEQELRDADDEMIQEYLSDNGIADAIKLEDSGVYYRITEEGNGVDFPTSQSIIRVFYKGYLLDGTVFDERVEGEDDYLESFIGNLVFGWQIALLNFSKGSKGQIFIPSHAGYGERPPAGSDIPENAILIFDIHLVNFF